MCKATLTLLLVLQVVPSSVLAQGISGNDRITLLCAEVDDSGEPDSAGALRSSLAALQRAEGLNGPARLRLYSRLEWLQQVPQRQPAESPAQPPKSPSRGWIGRHPALFGALVGAGAGAVATQTMDNELFCSGSDDDCIFHGGGRALIGAGIGAGVGSLVGWLVGLGSR